MLRLPVGGQNTAPLVTVPSAPLVMGSILMNGTACRLLTMPLIAASKLARDSEPTWLSVPQVISVKQSYTAKRIIGMPAAVASPGSAVVVVVVGVVVVGGWLCTVNTGLDATVTFSLLAIWTSSFVQLDFST